MMTSMDVMTTIMPALAKKMGDTITQPGKKNSDYLANTKMNTGQLECPEVNHFISFSTEKKMSLNVTQQARSYICGTGEYFEDYSGDAAEGR